MFSAPFRAFAAALVCVCACASGAAAQTDEPNRRALQLGPVSLAPSLTLKELGVDTNVFNEENPRKDFTLTLSPGVDVRIPFARRALLTTSAQADLVHYQTFASQRSVDPGARVRGELFLNRLTLFAEPSYLRTRQRLNEELDARALRQERGLVWGASLRAAPRLTFDAHAELRETAFDARETFNGTSLQETLNRQSRTGGARAKLELTPLTSVVLRAERTEDRFELSPVRDATSVRVSPGVEFKSGALISGSASVGFRSFQPESALVPSYTGVVANAGLDYTHQDTLRVAFSAIRDLTYSFEPDEPYFLTHGFGVTLDRRLFGPTYITLGAQRHRHAYRSLLDAGGAILPERHDDVSTYSGSIGYRFGRATRVGFGVMHRRRSSDSAVHRSYEGLRFITTANYGL